MAAMLTIHHSQFFVLHSYFFLFVFLSVLRGYYYFSQLFFSLMAVLIHHWA